MTRIEYESLPSCSEMFVGAVGYAGHRFNQLMFKSAVNPDFVRLWENGKLYHYKSIQLPPKS